MTINFNSDEFDDPNFPGSGGQINVRFLARLQEARSIANTEFKIISGVRVLETTRLHHDYVEDYQRLGIAAVIACKGDPKRADVLRGLIIAGMTHIIIKHESIVAIYHHDTRLKTISMRWK
jgi:hypothetical protein